MKEICQTRVKETEEIIAKAEKGDKNSCIPKENTRQLVGCMAAQYRDKKNMEFGDSVREAWRVVKKYQC